LLREGVKHLSPDSAYRRFFVPTHDLTDSQLTYLTTLDHHRVVPRDAVAHIHKVLARAALRMMRINMRAETPLSVNVLSNTIGD
jgi:hypothetical protein